MFYGVSDSKLDLHNKYMIQLCVWLIFGTRSSIKLNSFRSLCEKMTKMCTYFKTETDVGQNLIDDFFSNFNCQRIFP